MVSAARQYDNGQQNQASAGSLLLMGALDAGLSSAFGDATANTVQAGEILNERRLDRAIAGQSVCKRGDLDRPDMHIIAPTWARQTHKAPALTM